MLVIGDDDAGVRVIAAKDHVTAVLPPETETGPLQRRTNLPTRQVDRKLGHVLRFSLRSLDLDELLAGFGRNRVAGVAAVLQVKLDRLTDVSQRFGPGIALADASRHGRDAGDIATVCFLFQDDRVPHG
jgi:hypothetical protein